MRYDTAIYILKDLPKHWSNDAKSLKPEYAKQLLENKLIEEVEPGKYRTTKDGTYFSHYDHHSHINAPEGMMNLYHLTVEEIDLEPWDYRLQEAVLKDMGKPHDPETLDKRMRACIGQPSPG